MSTTEQTGRLEMDSLTESQPRIEPSVLGLAPQGGDPTPLPVARAASGTKTKLKAVPPPIPGRASTSTIPPPIPMVAAAQKPAMQADPDGWAAPASGSTSGPSYPSVYHHEPAAPDATVPTGAIEAAAEKPSPEWLAKIDSVMTDAPVEERVVNAHEKAVAEAREAEELARANAAANAALPRLPTARPSNAKLPPPSRTASGTRPPIPMGVKTVPPVAAAAAAMFTTKAKTPTAEAPVINTAPLELMDLEPVDHSDAQVIDPTPLPPAEPSDHNHDVLAKPVAIVAKPAAKKPTAQKQPAVSPLVEAARKSFEAENAGDFDIDWESNPDMTSAHTTNFELPEKSKLPQRAALGLLVAAVFATVGYLATRSKHPVKHPAPTVAATQPAPAPAEAPAPAAQAPTPAVAQTQLVAAPVAAQKAAMAPAQLQIPVSSMPPGAFVSLVDGEKADIVGQTPMTLTLDVTKPHDVALTMVGRETQLVHVPAGGLNTLAVTLPLKEGAQPAVAAAPKAAASDERVTAMVAPKQETPAPRHKAPAEHKTEHVAMAAPRVESAPAPKAITSAPAGSGMLMISSKPPCEIIVDGKSTHLQTPQRALPLAAGGHTIMLVNAQMHIKKTLAVDIVAKKPTKVIQDFLK